MSPKILVTGAAGYIGGSILVDLVERKGFEHVGLFALVRSDEQVESFESVAGVTVVRGDLNDGEGIIDIIVKNQIDLIVNCATCIDKDIILTFIKGLGQRKNISGGPVYLVHTSGASAFDRVTGWPLEATSDRDPLFDLEKKHPDYIVRDVDVFTTEQAEAHGVESVIMMPVNIHGRGKGPWNKMSIHFPGQVKTSIKQGRVHKFPENRIMPLVHIDDLTEYYGRLLAALLLDGRRDIPRGRAGYYMVFSHSTSWWDSLEALAGALYARGLVSDAEVHVWPSEEAASEALEMPGIFVRSIFNSGSSIIAENKSYFDWEPAWTRERFLEQIDSEIQDTLELATRTSLLRAIENEIKKK